ncbi:hypothetical protein CEXT_166381 [Caerostris extrusa]|uniref:Uncharacterized protein n=1 Tax=Caerostris extrusa TaxID=172846 RepID=A0AAV4V5W8_CAEEX|nr:hypothetical protein CEXT_166381 [Caerostris extrusa]
MDKNNPSSILEAVQAAESVPFLLEVMRRFKPFRDDLLLTQTAMASSLAQQPLVGQISRTGPVYGLKWIRTIIASMAPAICGTERQSANQSATRPRNAMTPKVI